eukprot:1177229-Prorocentrum_minimum.AAC.1
MAHVVELLDCLLVRSHPLALLCQLVHRRQSVLVGQPQQLLTDADSLLVAADPMAEAFVAAVVHRFVAVQVQSRAPPPGRRQILLLVPLAVHLVQVA